MNWNDIIQRSTEFGTLRSRDNFFSFISFQQLFLAILLIQQYKK